MILDTILDKRSTSGVLTKHQLLDEIQFGCFQYFWTEIGRPACLVKDRTEAEICSVAAVGFQLSSLPIGVERGWITKEEGAQRAKTVLASLLQT